MTFSVGDTIGAYEIVEKLGQGGMATVFKAHHTKLDRFVAIKVLHAVFQADESFLRRFTREARVVARLEHPHIVTIYDYAEHEGHPYLVMRYIDGSTLKERMAAGVLSRAEILRIAGAVANALDYAHKQGILHRDIKPSNVLLTNGGVFLTDYGLARITQAGESTLSQDVIMGTPQYISPEQAKGVTELDGRTDIYSFAIILYEMVTGQVPFQADTGYSVIHSQIFDAPPDPRELNDKVSPELADVLLTALSKEPADRQATAGELFTAFQQAIQALPDGIARSGANVLPDSTPPAATRYEPAAASPTLPPLPNLEREAEPEQETVDPAMALQAAPVTETAVAHDTAGPPKKSRARRSILVGIGLGMLLCVCIALGAIWANNNSDGIDDTDIVDADIDDDPPGAPVSNNPSPGDGGNPAPVFIPAAPESRPVEELEALLAEDPDNPQLRAEMAEALFFASDIEAARNLIRESFRPTRLPLPFLVTSERLLETQHPALAALVAYEGYERFPEDGRLQQLLIMATIESRQPERFVFELIDQLSQTTTPTTDITLETAIAYGAFVQGTPEDALLILDESLGREENPFRAEQLYLYGRILAAIGEPEAAVELFEEAFDHAPPPWLVFLLEENINNLN